MSTHFEPTAMDMDRDVSPVKSESAKSNISQISYTDDFESLPSSGSPSHAHIVDLGEYKVCVKEKGGFKLQDAVVTTLFNVSPETLKSFVSPTANTFKAVLGKRNTQLVIWRKGIEVGTFEHHTSMKAYRFEHVAGFLIGYDGSWHLKVTASNAYSASKWPDVWTGKFECRGGVAKMTVEAEEMDMTKQASALADSIIASKYWKLKTDIKTT